jgi:hypothetical protein
VSSAPFTFVFVQGILFGFGFKYLLSWRSPNLFLKFSGRGNVSFLLGTPVKGQVSWFGFVLQC